ncbi:MAG: hypothetical protein ACLT33_09485 [Lachnospira pectinoschiza]
MSYTDNAVKRLTVSDFDKVKTIFCKENAAEFKLLKQTATGILYDMEYFPVPHSSKTEQWVNYVNSWNYERTYKGNRTHEGLIYVLILIKMDYILLCLYVTEQ